MPRRGCAAARNKGTGFFVAPQFEETARLRLFKQIAEGTKAVICFVEIGLATLDRLLEHRRPDLAAVATFGNQGFKSRHSQINGLALARFYFLR